MNESNARPAKLLMTPEEAAQILSITRTRVYQLMRRGTLRSVKIGKARRVAVAALEAFVEQIQEEAELATTPDRPSQPSRPRLGGRG